MLDAFKTAGASPPSARRADFELTGHGSLYLLRPLTDAARAWITDHIFADPSCFLGEAVAVEHRYIGEIVEGAVRDGLTIS